jgi:hypothetical protein
VQRAELPMQHIDDCGEDRGRYGQNQPTVPVRCRECL